MYVLENKAPEHVLSNKVGVLTNPITIMVRDVVDIVTKFKI